MLVAVLYPIASLSDTLDLCPDHKVMVDARARTGLIVAALLLTTLSAVAQEPTACECPDPDAESPRPDTVFHVVEYFDVALCGRIDRSVIPFVYSEFTMRSCGRVRIDLRPRTPGRACHIAVSKPYLVVDEFALLPTGPDMHLENRPCWRTNLVLRVHEDTLKYAINAIRELIATFEKPTPEQFSQVEHHMETVSQSPFWMDKELLGQVFLCAVYDTTWATRLQDLRTTYAFGGTMADFYDELLSVYYGISRSSGITK